MYKKGNLKYPDPQGYYAIDQSGQLKWVSTPFEVSCIDGVGSIKENQSFIIDRIATTPNNDIVFIIGNYAYYNEHFNVAMSD